MILCSLFDGNVLNPMPDGQVFQELCEWNSNGTLHRAFLVNLVRCHECAAFCIVLCGRFFFLTLR